MTNSTRTLLGLLMQAGTTSAPSNLVAPSISGVVQQGHVLTADPGTWQGIPNPTIPSIIWKGAPGPAFTTYSPVAGGAGSVGSSTYTPTSADVGNKLKVTVTASNGVLPNGVQDSDPVGPVLIAPPDPVTPPTIQ